MNDPTSSDGRTLVLKGMVQAWQHDHFGHMNARWYSHFFDDASAHAFVAFGLDMKGLMAEHGLHTVSARATVTFVKELVAGDLIRIDAALSRIGSKSITLELRMFHEVTGELHATFDLIEVFFDPETRTSAAIPAEVRERLETL